MEYPHTDTKVLPVICECGAQSMLHTREWADDTHYVSTLSCPACGAAPVIDRMKRYRLWARMGGEEAFIGSYWSLDDGLPADTPEGVAILCQ